MLDKCLLNTSFSENEDFIIIIIIISGKVRPEIIEMDHKKLSYPEGERNGKSHYYTLYQLHLPAMCPLFPENQTSISLFLSGKILFKNITLFISNFIRVS